MEKTDQELWEEIVRTAETLKEIESHQLRALEKKVALEEDISKEDVPNDFIADAQILIKLVLLLKERDPEIA